LNLEELIRDRATKGEMVHLSLWHEISSGLWCATYAPAHEFGNSVARDKDPVKACETAITAPKTKRKVTAAVKTSNHVEVYSPGEVAGPTKSATPDTLDSWLPRA